MVLTSEERAHPKEVKNFSIENKRDKRQLIRNAWVDGLKSEEGIRWVLGSELMMPAYSSFYLKWFDHLCNDPLTSWFVVTH